jgi:D-tyrosyl-tRNA(Tyr) deacylase
LLADTRKGQRPGFTDAAAPAVAEPWSPVVGSLRALRLHAGTGVLRARTEVELVDDGPVTIVLDT